MAISGRVKRVTFLDETSSRTPCEGISRDLIISLLPMCAWGFLDSADSVYFSGVTRALEVDICLTMRQVQLMTSVLSACLVIFAPFWAAMVDRAVLSEENCLVATAFGWGCSTVGLAFVQGFAGLVTLRFVCTIFLSSSLPITQSIVTKHTHPVNRGVCFSFYGVFQALGALVSTKVSTTISEQRLLGMQGWRAGLLFLGVASVAFAMLLGCLGLRVRGRKAAERLEGAVCGPPEVPAPPPAAGAPHRGGEPWAAAGAVRSIAVGLSEFAHIYSFWALLLQCICHQFGANACSLAPMLMQYSGISDSNTGWALSMGCFSKMVGHVLLGLLADFLHRLSPLHGRAFLAQGVCLLMIPIVVTFGCVLPCREHGSSFALFSGLYCIAAFLDSGWGCGANRPILTMIAPRGRVASLQACKLSVEHIVVAACVAPLTILALSAKGYHSSQSRVSDMTEEQRHVNALALGDALGTISGIACAGMLGFYTVLQFTFWRDLRAREHEASDGERQPLLRSVQK